MIICLAVLLLVFAAAQIIKDDDSIVKENQKVALQETQINNSNPSEEKIFKKLEPINPVEAEKIKAVLATQGIIPDPKTDQFNFSIYVAKEWAFGTIGKLNYKKQLTEMRQMVLKKVNNKWSLLTADLYQYPKSVTEIKSQMSKEALYKFEYWLNMYD